MSRIILEIIAKSFFILMPICALVSVWPMVAESPPLMITSNLNAMQVLWVIPWYLGILSAPGYIAVVVFNLKKQNASDRLGKLIELSLKLAILSSFGGLIAILAVVPAPFVFGSIISSILVFKNYEKKDAGNDF